MKKEVILTGLRANSELTLGNYLGGIKPIVDLAASSIDNYQINMFMPDLHTITVEVDYQNLQTSIITCLKQYIAAGIDISKDNIFIYRQSYIHAHSELAWILECFTGFGEASRMVEFKDKTNAMGDERVSAGLYNYPMLMAADILLYDAKWVPVGEDQRQHLELTRTLATRFNNKFGQIFTVPAELTEQTAFVGLTSPLRIRSLKNPDKKMSKSVVDPSGTILLSDNPATAAKKILSATTDSYNEVQFNYSDRPGVSNLLQILALLSGQDLNRVVKKWAGQTSYGDLKKETAAVVESFLTDYQQKVATISQEEIMFKLETSEQLMSEVANNKLALVQQAVGLR